MAYIRREFYTKDKEMQRYLDSLMTELSVTLPPRLAQDIGRHKTIQNIRNLDRNNPFILICRDQKYHKSVIKIRDPLKIKKNGDKYIFDL